MSETTVLDFDPVETLREDDVIYAGRSPSTDMKPSKAGLRRNMERLCRVAATGNVNLASAPAAIDGVTMAENDRVFLFKQSTAAQNGIYVYPSAAGGTMVRADDMAADADVTASMAVNVAEGASYAGNTFKLTTAGPYTLGTTPLAFVAVAAPGQDALATVLTTLASDDWLVVYDLDGNVVAVISVANFLANNVDPAITAAIAAAGLDNISVSAATDLDAIRVRVLELDQSIILKGVWDASSGSFPGSGSAQAGEMWIVSVGGTVDGVTFVADEKITAIVDNASTSTFAANWHQSAAGSGDDTGGYLAGLPGVDALKALRRNAANNGNEWYTPVSQAAIDAALADVDDMVAAALAATEHFKTVYDFGAVGDAMRIEDAAINVGVSATTVTSPSNGFATAVVGQVIKTRGAGAAGADHLTTISAKTNDGEIEITDAASTTVAGVKCVFGTDDTAAFQAALDSGFFVHYPVAGYAITDAAVFSDGSKLVGDMCFFRPRAAYNWGEHKVTVIAYLGANTANTVGVRVSEKPVGTVGSDFSGNETDDLLAFRFEDVHIDAFGADFGAYFYRCGVNAYVRNISIEDATVAGFWGAGIFSVRWGYIGCHHNRGVGVRLGQNDFGWSAAEAAVYAVTMDFHCQSNGTAQTFVEDSGTDEEGCGGVFSAGRGSDITIQSEGSYGRAGVIKGGQYDAKAFFNLKYNEASNSTGNGAGFKISGYGTNSKGIHIRNGFNHPGNGSSIQPEDIKIDGSSADAGPVFYYDYLIIEGIHGFNSVSGLGYVIDSNTDKFRVINCEENVVFTDRYPAPEDQSRDDTDHLINGNFEIWQRGTSFTADGYTADRWRVALGGGTGTLSRQALTLGALTGLDAPEPRYFMRLAMTGAAANAGILQYIPSVRSYAGKRVFISFWAKSDTSNVYRMDASQVFGTGGSPSTGVSVVTKDFTIGTTWRRYQVSADVPSISGKTLGSDDNDYLQWRIRNTASETFTLDLACVQIDVGGFSAKSFRMRSEPEEYARCLPYFQRLVDANLLRPVAGAGQATSTTNGSFSMSFPAPMRKIPTLVLSDVGHFSLSAAGGGDLTCTAMSLTSGRVTRFGADMSATVASGLAGGNSTAMRATNASARFDLDAEIA